MTCFSNKSWGAGERIDFDINAGDGTLVFAVQGFRWPDLDQVPPQFRKGNRVTVPFRNVVGTFDPTVGRPSIIGASPQDAAAFASPRVSPDGARLLVVQGSIKEGNLLPQGLLTMPCVVGGMRSAAPIMQGEVYEPAWSSDGNRIVYVKRVGGKRGLFTMNADGTEDKSVAGAQGDFSHPAFSPQASK